MKSTNYNLNTGQSNKKNKCKEYMTILQHILVIVFFIIFVTYMIYAILGYNKN